MRKQFYKTVGALQGMTDRESRPLLEFLVTHPCFTQEIFSCRLRSGALIQSPFGYISTSRFACIEHSTITTDQMDHLL